MKKISILFCALLLSLNCSINIKAEDEIKPSDPEIETCGSVIIEEESDFDICKYVELANESEECKLLYFSDMKTVTPGNYTILLVATNSEGSTSSVFEVEVLSHDDYAKYLNSLRVSYGNSRYLNSQLAGLAGDGANISSAYDLALNFIGMGGYCNVVAQAFINAYYGPGHSIYNTYDVSIDEAQPGDIIFYTNGGLGLEHWAVYLGGDYALQGNYLGTTIIGKVYLNNASCPQFRRIIQ